MSQLNGLVIIPFVILVTLALVWLVDWVATSLEDDE